MKIKALSHIAIPMCIILLTSWNSFSSLCFAKQGNINSAGDYILALANALGTLKESADKTQSILARIESDKPYSETEVMERIIETGNDYDCAVSDIVAYKKSKNKVISVSANGLFNSLNNLKKINTINKNNLRDLLDGKKSKMRAGTATEKSALLSIAGNDDWSMILASVSLATNSGFNKKLTKGTLAITKKQRDDAISLLESAFGKEPPSIGQYKFQFAGSFLLEFLKGNWKSIDIK